MIEYGVKKTWADGYTEIESMLTQKDAEYRVQFYKDESFDFTATVVSREVHYGKWKDEGK